MNTKDDFALVPKMPTALEKVAPGTKRVLSGMVLDALALVKKQRRSKPRIVIVNDWPEPIRLMELLIRDRFEEVTLLTFRNGVEAWQELQREAPDLLITDMRRENDPMDGWVMISLLAEKKVKYPVVVVSGYTENAAKHYDKTGKPVSVTFRELLQQARQTINITAMAMPFESEEFLKVLEDKLKIPGAKIQTSVEAAAPLQKARQEWVQMTTPHPKEHFYENGKRQGIDEFRKYGQAIALINWEGEYIEITKLEKLPRGGRGAAVPLVEFLKTLADKYHGRISGHAKRYDPDPPVPEGPLLSQEELEAWYERRGFHLHTQGKPAPTWVWYPDIPHIYTDDADEAQAAFNRGSDYYSGSGVPQDYAMAAQCFREAAEKGHVAAQCRLGFCYNFGKGVTEDTCEAVRWYRVAAEQGYAEAQYYLGSCYEKGDGVAQDNAEALRWYLKAAEQGNIWAQQWLGICYQSGQIIVPQDYVEAAKWFRKAAEQGEAHSQYCLGVLLENGRGVAKDYAEAIKWYDKAAEQGEPKAQRNLGLCFENGFGVQRDLPEAYKFYKLAADYSSADEFLDDDFTPFQGKSAKNLEQIVARMTVSEIAEGERRYLMLKKSG